MVVEARAQRDWHGAAEQSFGGNEPGHNLLIRMYRSWFLRAVPACFLPLQGLAAYLDGEHGDAAVFSVLGAVCAAAAVTAYRHRDRY